jgi:hypothetical protein
VVELPGVDAQDGDALVHALIERGGQDPDWLTAGQLAGNPIRMSANEYRLGRHLARRLHRRRAGASGAAAAGSRS